MSSAFFEHISIVFNEERIRRPCAIVTDRDAAILELPEDPEDDDNDQAHARAADANGEARQEHLVNVAEGNEWLEPFFADHTFEVDFLSANNEYELISLLPEIFKSQASINRSEERLNSDEVAIYGKEVLRLANKVGKGWFALLLAEKLTNLTYLPDYILRAVAFACHLSVTDAALQQAAHFRMKQDDTLAATFRTTDGYEDLDAADFLESFCQEEPEDALSLFRSFIEEYRTK